MPEDAERVLNPVGTMQPPADAIQHAGVDDTVALTGTPGIEYVERCLDPVTLELPSDLQTEPGPWRQQVIGVGFFVQSRDLNCLVIGAARCHRIGHPHQRNWPKIVGAGTVVPPPQLPVAILEVFVAAFVVGGFEDFRQRSRIDAPTMAGLAGVGKGRVDTIIEPFQVARE